MKLNENWREFATKSSDKQIIAHLTSLRNYHGVAGLESSFKYLSYWNMNIRNGNIDLTRVLFENS
jgi:hypothetical protein